MPSGYPADPTNICGAKARHGGVCHRQPMMNGRCYMHGGKSPSGPAHHNWKTGLTSRVIPLPDRFKARVESSMEDPELLSMRESISVLNARLDDLYSQVDSGESGSIWESLKKSWAEWKQALMRGRKTEMEARLSEVEDLIERGQDQHVIWAEIRLVMEAKRVQSESERKRMEAMQQNITTEELYYFINVLMNSLKLHIKDRTLLEKVVLDVRRLLGNRQNPGRVYSGDAGGDRTGEDAQDDLGMGNTLPVYRG